MDLWNVLTAAGTVAAAGVAVWAVVVAHGANKIAREALPPRAPVFELRTINQTRWRFTNVGTAPLYDARAYSMLDASDENDSGEPQTLEPGDHVDLEVWVLPPYQRVQIRGYEIRDGRRIPRTIEPPL